MNKKTKKAVNGAVIGTMLFSMVNFTSATNETGSIDEKPVYQVDFNYEVRENRLEDKLEEIVEKNIVSKDQATNIAEKLTEYRDEIIQEKKDKVKEKIEKEEITKDQYNNIVTKIDNKKVKGKFNLKYKIENLDETLDQKLDEGKITEAQYNQIKLKIKDKITYRRSRLSTILEKLVEDEIITKYQSEQIFEYLIN
ncbi:hypothetical protein GOQ27_10610 [Clostridium sp. D2Q-11]|uniref:Uncharacterized protein n=1 Tax=Anaeromonas frigoriresistens TaxID=2683708 RepID=A0A942UTG0_9FIRM|nr:hypothetical protein [Anaeromonas frigoriresistens]MBS4538919.1 hypothetical protein [Anaeromonas frigoriresistens]